VQLKDAAQYASNVDAFVGDSISIDTVHTCDFLIPLVPQITSNIAITDTQHWVKIQGSFIANGTENRIAIGNFNDSAHTILQQVSTTFMGYPEYALDDISVVAVGSSIYAGKDTAISYGKAITLGAGITDGLPCEWYNSSGALLNGGSNPIVKPTTTTFYTVTMDLCGTITTDTLHVKVWPLGVEELGGSHDIILYPNPAPNQLTVISNQLTVNTIEVMDVLGRVMLSLSNQINSTSKIEHQKEIQIDISDLANGIYFIKATNEKGNVSVGKFVKE
jgi:hypothetical protein